MEEYNIYAFISRIKDTLYKKFPRLLARGYNPNGTPKHGTKNREIRDVALKQNHIITINEDMFYFEIGNEEAERDYPYYHILQDSPVIHKKDKGTKRSKGSQQYITDRGARDYSITSFNGKTFTKEYVKNVRGARKSVVDNSTRFVTDTNGKRIKINASSDTYKNIHYRYIDRILDANMGFVGNEFGMIQRRKANSTYAEEYLSENYDEINEIINIMASL